MEEELLFRVWDSQNKRYRNDLILQLDRELMNQRADTEDEYSTPYSMYCQVQFATTQRDKNNKQIFLNDIVKDKWNQLLLVKWQNETAGFILEEVRTKTRYRFNETFEGKTLEVIGNLNEHPQLLNEGV